ncbi:MAG: zinc ribbon domain-containing protein [Nitrospinae bacterium]|nr:zinc ribbon domain-containing protein [Nitrospinota bacterium]
MPIYEYHCEQCGHTTEITHGISETRSPKCPSCKKKMKRIISRNAFHLKGGGWYKTGGYAKSGGEKKAEGDTSSKTSE